MRAIGYARVSTDDQSSGLATQKVEITKWAASAGATLEAIFEDEDCSGATEVDKRPGLMAALAALRKGSVLVAFKRDRFARDPEIMMMLSGQVKKKGARLMTCDGATGGDGPVGELMEGIIDNISRFERRIIGQRVAAGMRRKKAMRSFLGCPPYGWRRGTEIADEGTRKGKRITLEPVPEEQAIVGYIRQLRAEGATLREIVSRLEAEGHPPRGARWHLTSVARIISYTLL